MSGRGRPWPRRSARRCASAEAEGAKKAAAKAQIALPEEEAAEEEKVLILRSRASKRGVSKDGRGHLSQPMVRDAQEALLTMRLSEADEANEPQATWLWVSAAYSGSTSQITRLRPLRLAA